MTDITGTLALAFGCSLFCVLFVVYLLSKRQITMTQNNSTSVTTTERTDSSTGGSGRLERAIVKWSFIVLVAGIALATLANAITTSLTTSFPNASVGNPQQIAATPSPMPTVAAHSISSPVKRSEDGGGREGVSPLTIIVPLLAVVAAGIWSVAVIGLAKHRARRRLIDSLRAASSRESHLEAILPDAVSEL